MPLSARGALPLLFTMLWVSTVGAEAADATAAGLTVVVFGEAPGVPVASRLTQQVADAVAVVTRLKVDAAAEPLPLAALFEDLRRLPAGAAKAVQRSELADSRYLLCLRCLDGPNLGVGELALIDLKGEALVGYRTVSYLPAEIAEAFAVAAAELACAGLPANLRTPRESPAPLARASFADVSRSAVGRIPTAAAGAPKPAPRPVPLPVAVGAAAPTAVVASPEAILHGFADVAVGAVSLGRPLGPPRLEEATYNYQLAVADGEPCSLTVTVFSVGAEMRVEAHFARPVTISKPTRRSNWVCFDVAGMRPEREQVVEVGRGGLLSVHLKPGPDGGTRLGFLLTGAGDLTVDTDDDGQTVVATSRRDAERMFVEGIVNPEPPFQGPCRVKRTFYGLASWYGGGWHGGPTASGERYDQWGWTAAHRTLPLGTWIRVTNPANGRAAILRVNDRGPYVGGRVLDVTVACAKALGFYGQGVCRLKIEVLERP